MAGIIGSGRAYTKERALVDEAHNLLNAVRAYQSDHAAPLSEYNDAAEVGWPGTKLEDLSATPPQPLDTDCADALNILAGGAGPADPNYISTQYQDSQRGRQSLVFPGLSWVASCDGEQFRLRLTSFGDAEICTPRAEEQSGECPRVVIAQNLAGATGGAVLPENTGVTGDGGPGELFDGAMQNSYVDWTVWRGAAYPALNRLAEQLVWKDYNRGAEFSIPQSTTAFSGIRLGGWEDGAATYLSGTPPKLARFIGSVDSTNINRDLSPLPPVGANYIDGRSFAMFYRVARHDPFDTAAPDPLIRVPDPTVPDPLNHPTVTDGPCIGSDDPTWLATIESIRLSFPGFADTDQATITLRPVPDQVTLIPTAWQVYDNAPRLRYNPEVTVDFLTVLPGFLRDATLPTENYCYPVVVHGHVNSRDVAGLLAVFEQPSGQVQRDCNFTNGSGPAPVFTQTLPDLQRVDIGSHQGNPAVRLSAVGYCHMPGNDVRS